MPTEVDIKLLIYYLNFITGSSNTYLIQFS